MKLKGICSIAVAMALLCGNAFAAITVGAPGTPTQERAVKITATCADETQESFELSEQPADQKTMDMASSVYNFVYEEGNKPVQWFPEETQEAIAELSPVDPETLSMTEIVRLKSGTMQNVTAVTGTLKIAIDYQVDQPIVVILGYEDESGTTVWEPVQSKVTDVGVIQFTIPAELVAKLQGKEVLLTVMTVVSGTSETETTEQTITETVVDSKTAETTTRVETITTTTGEPVPSNFQIRIVVDSIEIQAEVADIEEHLSKDGTNALSWLPESDQDRVRYLLGTDGSELIVSDYLPLESVNYVATTGDAVAIISFATPYKVGQKVVTALGTPNAELTDKEGTSMNWSVQPATVLEDGSLEVVFDQLALIEMGKQTGMLLVFSEPVEEEETEAE